MLSPSRPFACTRLRPTGLTPVIVLVASAAGHGLLSSEGAAGTSSGGEHSKRCKLDDTKGCFTVDQKLVDDVFAAARGCNSTQQMELHKLTDRLRNILTLCRAKPKATATTANSQKNAVEVPEEVLLALRNLFFQLIPVAKREFLPEGVIEDASFKSAINLLEHAGTLLRKTVGLEPAVEEKRQNAVHILSQLREARGSLLAIMNEIPLTEPPASHGSLGGTISVDLVLLEHTTDAAKYLSEFLLRAFGRNASERDGASRLESALVLCRPKYLVQSTTAAKKEISVREAALLVLEDELLYFMSSAHRLCRTQCFEPIMYACTKSLLEGVGELLRTTVGLQQDVEKRLQRALNTISRLAHARVKAKQVTETLRGASSSSSGSRRN